MSPRGARRVAWTLVLTFLACMGLAIYFGYNPPPGIEPIRLIDAIWALSFTGFPVTGALIAARFPTRVHGWLLCIAPLLLAIGLVLGDTGAAAAAHGRSAAWFGWAANLTFSSALAMLLFFPLLLPDGRLPSPRWRIVLRVMLGFAALWVASSLFAPGRLEEFPEFTNPVGIEPLAPVFELVKEFAGPAFLMMLIASVTALIVRFRGSSGHERQQLKWLAYGATVVLLCFLVVPVVEATTGDLGDVAVTLVTMVAFLALPVTIGVAILRFRLYDIDVIINRTLVYGALTAILTGAYFGLVVLFQRALRPLTEQSDIAVAASTLAVAALFGPMRRRTQQFIDHRFYRSRYDAQKTLESFSARLRDEVELEHLSSELLQVVTTTMRPRHASLWLRETG